jgi:hypothetical protein
MILDDVTGREVAEMHPAHYANSVAARDPEYRALVAEHLGRWHVTYVNSGYQSYRWGDDLLFLP